MPGHVTRAFFEASTLLWEHADVKQLSDLREIFVQMHLIFDAVRNNTARTIIERIRPFVRRAYNIVHLLNVQEMPSESRAPYLLALTLKTSDFGVGEDQALKKAVYAIKVPNQQERVQHQSQAKRKCRYCANLIDSASFKEHNKVCTGKNK